MTMQLVLILTGGLLQIVGVATTIWGAVDTWNEFSPNERILASTRTRIKTASAAARRKITSLLGMSPPPRHTSTRGTASLWLTASARARKQFGHLDVEADARDALSELDCRTREIMDRLHDVRDTLTDQQSELRDRIAALERDLEARVADLGQQDQRVATGGIKTALWGLVLVAAGVGVQTVAAFFPAG